MGSSSSMVSSRAVVWVTWVAEAMVGTGVGMVAGMAAAEAAACQPAQWIWGWMVLPISMAVAVTVPTLSAFGVVRLWHPAGRAAWAAH